MLCLMLLYSVVGGDSLQLEDGQAVQLEDGTTAYIHTPKGTKCLTPGSLIFSKVPFIAFLKCPIYFFLIKVSHFSNFI